MCRVGRESNSPKIKELPHCERGKSQGTKSTEDGSKSGELYSERDLTGGTGRWETEPRSTGRRYGKVSMGD